MANEEILASIAQITKETRFATRFNNLLVQTVSDLLRDLGGVTSEQTRKAIHDRLPAIYEAAMDLPREGTLLAGLDMFLALFPPPGAPDHPPGE